MTSPRTPGKFNNLTGKGLFPLLGTGQQEFLRSLTQRYHLTVQEFRLLIEYTRDLDMWQERPLSALWAALEAKLPAQLDPLQRKKKIFIELDAAIEHLKQSPSRYKAEGITTPRRQPLSIVSEEKANKIFGDCPVASEKTVCCNLKTIDAVENCAYGCSYCTIQTFYGESVSIPTNLKERLQSIELDPDRFYHIGTGQSSDSLVWGNKNNLLGDLCKFAADNPNVLLEFKTKSANTAYFLANEVPENLVCSWSLNTDTVVRSEEHFTASLDSRLSAARQIADCGIKVAFHFHPIVYYEGWSSEYPLLVERVLDLFEPEEVLFVSFGSVTFIKPVVQQIRKRGEASKILQMKMVPDPHGKLTYSDDIKNRLFATVHEAFKPWHEKVFMYLCMERAYFWDMLFGWHYPTNEDFERDMGQKLMMKIHRNSR